MSNLIYMCSFSLSLIKGTVRGASATISLQTIQQINTLSNQVQGFGIKINTQLCRLHQGVNRIQHIGLHEISIIGSTTTLLFSSSGEGPSGS